MPCLQDVTIPSACQTPGQCVGLGLGTGEQEVTEPLCEGGSVCKWAGKGRWAVPKGLSVKSFSRWPQMGCWNWSVPGVRVWRGSTVPCDPVHCSGHCSAACSCFSPRVSCPQLLAVGTHFLPALCLAFTGGCRHFLHVWSIYCFKTEEWFLVLLTAPFLFRWSFFIYSAQFCFSWVFYGESFCLPKAFCSLLCRQRWSSAVGRCPYACDNCSLLHDH